MKKIYFLFLMTLLPLMASAETLEINGINYNLDPESKTAAVISKSSGYYSGDIVIPKTVIFKSIECKVTSIGEYAFYYCSGLTSVTIPNSITSIGANAFYYCSGLTSVTIPNSITSIGANAFYYCSGLTSVTIPNSVTSIGNGAFYGTPWYNNQPDGVVYAGKVLYKYKGTMPEGTKISIKEGTLSITAYVFSECSGLTSVTIPNSVTSIGDGAFSGCSGLTSVTIPNSVTRIEDYTFHNCISLATVILGSNINYIGSYAFAYCGQLTDFYCFAEEVPSCYYNYYEGYTSFSNSYINYVTLHVPAGSVETYKARSPWSEFKDKVAIETVKVKLNKTKVTLEKGKTVTLKATITPSTFPDKSVTWKSSNKKVATVTSSGKVKAVKAGTATITCTSEITGEKATCKVTVFEGSVTLDKTEVTLQKGKTVTLKATVEPTTLEDKSVTWTSSDKKVATVTSSGKVKGVKAGTATITCTSNATGMSATCKVTVVNGTVTLNKTEAYIEKGKTTTLKATLTPTDLSDKSVTWKSSDKSIATVTSKGKVKGVGYGTATITCTSNATGVSATCQVTVGKVVINISEVTLKKTRTMTLKATVYPTTLTDKSVTWTSSDKSVATVTSSGKVKGIAAGTATITCTSVATGLKGTCTVTVLSTSESRSIVGDDDDEVTGIENIEETPALTEPYDVYDLSGHKVRHQVNSLDGLPDGIYIVNGRKMLKK